MSLFGGLGRFARIKEQPNNTLFISNVDVTVENTVVETTIIGDGAGTVTIPGHKLKKDAKFLILAQGVVSDVANPTFQIRVKLGGVLLVDSGANTLNIQTDEHVTVMCEIMVRSIGVTGTVVALGDFQTSASDHFAMVDASPTVIDTTIDQLLDITVEWGTANASNTVTFQITELHEYNVRKIGE